MNNVLIFLLFLINLLLIIKSYLLYKKSKKLSESLKVYTDNNLFLQREINRLKFQITLLNNKSNSKKRILIGDYNIESLKYTISILKKFDLSFDIVTSSNDIIDKIEHGLHYDLIITNNLYKNGCDGPTMLKKLKTIKNFNIPVIISTVNLNKKDYFINTCNFDYYIEKPLTEKKLKEIINKYLN